MDRECQKYIYCDDCDVSTNATMEIHTIRV